MYESMQSVKYETSVLLPEREPPFTSVLVVLCCDEL